MSLLVLAESFLRLSQQLNLFAPPTTIQRYLTIPPALIPTLHKLTRGKGSGSDMDVVLTLLKDNKKVKNHTFSAVVLFHSKKVIGWALIGKEDHLDSKPEFKVDIFIDPKYRRFNLGALLKQDAINYGVSLGYQYSEFDHFEFYKTDIMPSKEQKLYKRRKYLTESLQEAEEQLSEHRQALILNKTQVGDSSNLSREQIQKGIEYWANDVKELKQKLNLLPKSDPNQLGLPGLVE